jgi:hypothetical protein
MMFLKVTEEQLLLNIKRRSVYRIIAICITGSCVLLLKFLPPYLPYWQLPCYCVCVLVLGTNITMFSTMFQGLITAATILNTCFKVRKR